MSIQVSHRTIRFKPGYEVKEEIIVPSFNRGKDWILGALEEEPKSVEGAIFIGKPAEFGNMDKNVWIDTKAAHVVYIIGKRRSGKSFTLGVLAEGLASEGRQAILIFDTMNVFWTLEHPVQSFEDTKGNIALKEWGIENLKKKFNVKCYFVGEESERYPSHFNKLTLKASELEGEDWAALFGKDVFSDPIGQLLAELVESIREGYQVGSKKIPPTSEYTIDDMLFCLEKNQSLQRYEIKTVEAVRRYLKAIKRLRIFTDKGINIHEIFKPGQISVLLLRDVDPLIRGLIVGIIVKKIMYFRAIGSDYERRKALIQKRKDLSDEKKEKMLNDLQKELKGGLEKGWILIDEAQNYIPNVGVIASKKPLIKYINEGRNIGLSLAAATQRPSGLDSSIIRNADIIIIHPISMGEDIAEAKNMLNTYIMEEFSCEGKKVNKQVFERLVRSLKIGYAVISNDMISRIFVAKIRPRLTIHGGEEIW
jgi:DNA helicase HerA-like ATPase